MIDLIRSHLDAGDDPRLWEAVLDRVMARVDWTPGALVQVGRCSHWLRPHQSRWITPDGEFAWPTGYGSGQGGMSVIALPQFDWSVVLTWVGDQWLPAADRSARPALRLAIPSRTMRHAQAAVHAVWMTAKEKETRFYGFRRTAGAWACTAETRWASR